jgi:hypothetical protein
VVPPSTAHFPSAFSAPVGGHSEKPDQQYEHAEFHFPSLPKIELNARRARDGWDAWGYEAPSVCCAEDSDDAERAGGGVGGVDASQASLPSHRAENNPDGPDVRAADQSPAKVDAYLAATEGAQAPAAEGMDSAASRLADGRTSDLAGGDGASASLPAGEFQNTDAPGCTAASAGGAAKAPAAPPESEPLDIPAFLKRRPDNSLPPRDASEAA